MSAFLQRGTLPGGVIGGLGRPERPQSEYLGLASPRECDWALLEKIGRYLIHRPLPVIRFAWQQQPGCIDACTDSNWG